MKGIKGRILKQLKSVSQVPYLKHHDEAVCPPPCPRSVLGDLPVVDSDDLTRSLEEDDEGSDLVGSFPSSCDKENYRPPPPSKGDAFMGLDEKKDGGERYRRPDPESETLFDPELLTAFREAVMEHTRGFEEYKRRARARADALIESNGEGDPPQVGEAEPEPPTKLPRTDDSSSGAALNPLMEFEYRCPPGGEESVILYTTTLRGIRKTFEDCSGVRFLLQSLKIRFFERDVSMHLAFRKELWGALEGRAIPPRLFILGRYIGGADEVLGLHEQGRLLPLLQRVQTEQSARDGAAGACEGCDGVKFAVCWQCSGSRKVHGEEELGATQCRHCNENGLVLCPICC
ncbi:NF-kappa-B inhibitor-like protein 1 [Zingiber officinale]|uniref:NF-kappa-B inhibitor-like protein 1 n=1 Tax=Zingiber officinale TaxID=94328 RepID=UPI001C4DB0CE|nr:NF-kappa-B inhibitor-like protein 1 [Zingiber officinale]